MTSLTRLGAGARALPDDGVSWIVLQKSQNAVRPIFR
jgi:hypothetical protein